MAQRGVLTALWAVFHSFLHGFHIASLNGVQDAVTCDQTGSRMGLKSCLDLPPTQFGIVVTIYTLGGLLGSLGADSITRRFGRTGTLRVAEILFILGLAGVGLANAMWLMVIARILSGVGAGLSLVTVPLLLSEVSSKSFRTFFGTLHQISIGIGMILAQSLSFAFAKPFLWRYVLLVGFCIAVALFLVSWTISEQQPDQEDEEGNESEDEERPLLDRDEQGKKDVSVKSLLKSDKLVIRGMLIVIAGQFGQQICGISPVMYFSTGILAPVFQSSSKIVALAVMAIGIPFNFVPGLLPSWIGSRRMLLISAAGTAITAITLGVGLNAHLRALSGVSVIAFVMLFSIGLAPVPWVVLSEVVAPEARTAVGAVTTSVNWSTNFVAGAVFLPLQQALKHGDEGEGNVFFVFAAASGIAFTLVWLSYRFYERAKSE